MRDMSADPATLHAFVRQYKETAEWCQTYRRLGVHDEITSEDVTGQGYPWSAAANAQVERDCLDFLSGLTPELLDLVSESAERAGHDFLLTRNGHGAGFWDGDWPEAEGRELTKHAKAQGTAAYEIDDDGNIVCIGRER